MVLVNSSQANSFVIVSPHTAGLFASGKRAMGEAGASALWYVLGLISEFVSKINADDVAGTLILFVPLLMARLTLPKAATWGHGTAIKVARGYFENLFDLYAGRFVVRAFRHKTCRYSLWLASALWAHTFLILSLWPTWVGLGIIVLSALAVVLTMSVLGYRTRGPQGNIRRFGIFYEPSFALVSTFLMGKLPDLASRSFSKLTTLLM
jgi:hypothetical protein